MSTGWVRVPFRARPVEVTLIVATVVMEEAAGHSAEKRAGLTVLFKLLTSKPASVSSIARRRTG